jgi:uncharacterized protein DUF4340
MNWKPTWVLLTTAVVALAFIVSVEQPLQRRRQLQASRVILPGLNPALVTNIVILPWSQPPIQAARSNAADPAWSLLRPVAYPAESATITRLLNYLAKLAWVDRVSESELTDRPLAQEEFGFSKPRFTLLLQGSGPDRHLEIGDLGAFNDRISLQVWGNNDIYQVSSDILRWIPTDKNDWRDLSFLNLTNLSYQTLRVRAAGKEFDLERDATNHLWLMRKPPARADTPKINDLLSRLQKAFISGFVTDDPHADLESYGLQSSDTTPELVLSFLDGTNKVAGVQVGGSPTNHPDLAFARRDGAGNIVLVAKDSLKLWEAPYTNFLDQHFISLSPSLVECIQVRGQDDFEVRKQTNGAWLVLAGQSYPADAQLMDLWLSSLTNVPTEIVKTVVTDFAPYGLSNASLQYVVRFRAGAGESEARIDFGTNAAGKVFERRRDEDFVNSISSDDYRWLPRVSWQLRDRQVWGFEPTNVVSITVRQGGGTLKYLRDPDGNWTYAPGSISQVVLNSPALQECVFQIGRLRAIYWDGVGEKNLDKFGFEKTRHEVDFEVKHGGANEIFRLQFGSPSPMLHPYASVVRDGQRLIFEFPADLYDKLVEPNLTLFTARHNYH